MGVMHRLKAGLGPARDTVSGFARQHGGQIEHGLDRAARLVDEKTKGKYSGKVRAGTDKAKAAVDRLAHRHGPGTGAAPGDGPTPPAG
ncbi:antitoxin [Streptomyces sp. NPDC046831]|uniref:antitoxin n=1 Tax=Streptomyces sp. NPDC046831 TaxID=3154805 RepID=UPI0033E6104C